jgi:ribonuclease HII
MHALIDGLPVPDFPCPQTSLVGGDGISYSIAAASIIAKEAHDQWVKDIIEENPDLHTRYGLGTNMGYGTSAHVTGLKQWGAHALHRKSFAPVRAVCPPTEISLKQMGPLFKT